MTTYARSHPEVLFDGLSFPTSLAIDEDGVFYVAESGLPFGGATPGGRIWRLESNERRTLLVDDLRHSRRKTCRRLRKSKRQSCAI